MDKNAKVIEAKELFFKSYNCAQSTAVPFAEECGMEKDTMLKACSAFGGGVAGLKEVCGVVMGITMVVGLIENRIDTSDKEAKAEIKGIAQGLIKKFTDINKTINCGELLEDFEKNPLPAKEGEEYYAEKPCTKLVEDGVRILCDYIEAKQ